MDFSEVTGDAEPDESTKTLSLIHIFPLKVMQSCMVDAMVDWTDVNWFGLRRYGLHPVSIGYDPSLTGDSAGLVAVSYTHLIASSWCLLPRVYRSNPP